MNMHLKEMGERAHPRHWSGFAWSMVLFVLLCSVGTALVGVKLYQVTDHEPGYSTH
jgi:hypothetical protein